MAAITKPQPAAAHPEARRIVAKHHILVRIAHWLNIPLLLGLILSGLAIYWASPVYTHKPDASGNDDYLADIGIWVCRRVPGLHHYGDPQSWVYNHSSLGTAMLAEALRLHWLLAYLFMLIGAAYIAGLIAGGGYRALLPRQGDFSGVLKMMRYYIGLPLANIRRKEWPHPQFGTKYNPMQRLAYFTVPICGFLSVLTGWAMHKPVQLAWLTALFGGYDYARVWHFLLMWVFVLFVIPHVVLVIADGWDTFRSMVTGWSERAEASHDAGAK